MPPIALPIENDTTPSDGHAEAHAFSILDTLHVALSSCTPSISIPGPSACFPCLRAVPSDDSLNQHLNPEPRPAPRATHNTRRVGPGGRADAGWTPNPDGSAIPRARPDELQGLLASHSSSSEDDAERVSMHSNFGRNRRKKRKEKKKITLFGFDLFGATRRKAKPAPITLGEEDDAIYSSALPDHTRRGSHDDDEAGGSRRSGEDPLGSTPSLGTIHTSATFDADSDAAPLSASVIDGLSSSPRALELLAQSALLEEQRLLQAKSEKEERRRKRREKREAKYGGKESKETRDGLERERLKLERAKMQGVLPEDGQGEEFEGFQGSGSALPAARLVLGRRSRSGTTSSSSSRTTSRTGESGSVSRDGGARESGKESRNVAGQAPTVASAPLEDFGDFVSVESNGPEEGEADEVDLDGELYAGPRRSYAEHRSARGSSSNGDSKSRGSGAGSQGQNTAPAPPYDRDDAERQEIKVEVVLKEIVPIFGLDESEHIRRVTIASFTDLWFARSPLVGVWG
ncbi:hypothetical protein FA13DRAFT_1718455 [Coprinellus micaceus]|uniref:Uncharacterized protein n=1 Tax=Coprinellus micaceus TaxID=71717 RepID=A0A4Y7SDV7_COPMI|nr:hypothetical protein FA13DRAFT_1718455 [Coprinellus micaceus]